MADQKKGSGKILQQLFKQLKGFNVQIVGRFVQHQDIGRPRKQAGQQQTVALATGQGLDRRARPFRREEKIAEIANHMLSHTGNVDIIRAG
ncbi:MAG: hypothetical protein BWY57_00001 [Betaproteobacteria bacterium ADurb.Bin341]|nr:MAG: hypothetical protein BWY57_00001 [Betaproteobacteria bacterium ADurb.Bin341]